MRSRDQVPPSPWLHIGECPVCVNGLCRVRTCVAPDGTQHFLAVCDECEAIWTEPDVGTIRLFPDATDPRCPICDQPLYGDPTHWTTTDEVAGSDWDEQVIVELVSGEVEFSADGVELPAQNSVDHPDDVPPDNDAGQPSC